MVWASLVFAQIVIISIIIIYYLPQRKGATQKTRPVKGITVYPNTKQLQNSDNTYTNIKLQYQTNN